jgi:hypothetical protein
MPAHRHQRIALRLLDDLGQHLRRAGVTRLRIASLPQTRLRVRPMSGPALSRSMKSRRAVPNNSREVVAAALTLETYVAVSDLLTWQPGSMKPALVVLQFDYPRSVS